MEYGGTSYTTRLTQKPYINCAGLLRDEPNWSAIDHFHARVTELQYIVEGNGIFVLNGTSYAIKAGDLLVIHSGETHRDDFRRSKPSVKTYFLRFCGYQICGLPENRLLPPNSYPIVHAQSVSGQMLFYFQNIYSECCQQAPGFETIVDNYLCALLLLVLRTVQGRQSQVEHLSRQASLAREIQEFIDLNLSSPLSVSVIAQSFNISMYHLMHVFRNEIGVAPIQYLTSRRISKSKKLLENSDLAIRDIARLIGYTNQSNFNTQFKRITGMPPGKYRELNRGKDDFHTP